MFNMMKGIIHFNTNNQCFPWKYIFRKEKYPNRHHSADCKCCCWPKIGLIELCALGHLKTLDEMVMITKFECCIFRSFGEMFATQFRLKMETLLPFISFMCLKRTSTQKCDWNLVCIVFTTHIYCTHKENTIFDTKAIVYFSMCVYYQWNMIFRLDKLHKSCLLLLSWMWLLFIIAFV